MSDRSKRKDARAALTADEKDLFNNGFTPKSVKHILDLVILKPAAKVPAERSPAVIDMARILNDWRAAAAIDRSHVAKKKLCQNLAAVLGTLREIVPHLRAQFLAGLKDLDELQPNIEQQYRSIEPMMSDIARCGDRMRDDITEGIKALDVLSLGVQMAGSNAPLSHPANQAVGITFWQAYAGRLDALLRRTISDSGCGDTQLLAVYRFIVAVIPGITGEHITFDSVRSHLKEKRPVNWGNRSL